MWYNIFSHLDSDITVPDSQNNFTYLQVSLVSQKLVLWQLLKGRGTGLNHYMSCPSGCKGYHCDNEEYSDDCHEVTAFMSKNMHKNALAAITKVNIDKQVS